MTIAKFDIGTIVPVCPVAAAIRRYGTDMGNRLAIAVLALCSLAASAQARLEARPVEKAPARVAPVAREPFAAGSILTVSPSAVAFGNVIQTNLKIASVTLTNSTSTAITVSSISVTGSGGVSPGATAQFVTSLTWPVNQLPITVDAGKTLSFGVMFFPTEVGAFSSTFTIGGATLTVTGTGQALGPPPVPYQVELSWDAPESSDPVVGYNVYRAVHGSGAYGLLNLEAVPATEFTDGTPVSGDEYDYVVTSVDGAGVESAPSNVYTAAIP